ncbi:hypothetical protein AwDysgo_07510 [Bacteroidales bacterium]|nr:hypothetical protein AwDysgo_07510 [Bacteroidales bacterium]
MKISKKKLFSTLALSYFCVCGVSAQGMEKGIEYFRAELFDAAKMYFYQHEHTVGVGEGQAELYFYLGESHAATEQTDSAIFYYQKAVAADPEYSYAYIAEGKLALQKQDSQSAQKLFARATRSDKKNPQIYTSVAQAYIAVKEYALAEEALSKARKVDRKFSGIFVAEGDALMQQGKVGEACSRYENAILYDKNDKVAYLKEARVYKNIEPQLSLDILDRLIQVDPDYIPAYAEIGEINYARGYYVDAINAYAKFIEIPGVPLKHQINYASLLYFTKEYDKSLEQIKIILVHEPDNVVMHRLQAYNNYELKNYELGLQEIEHFFAITPEDQVITLDFITYGRLLEKNKKADLAVMNLKKALTLDDSKLEIYKEIAIAYSTLGNYVETVSFYKQYFAKDENAPLGDIFNAGIASYNAANQQGSNEEPIALDSTLRLEYLNLADDFFSQVVERSPDTYLGYFWRARCQSAIDLDTSLGLAKPYYDEAVEKMEANNADNRRDKDLIEAYSYLGYYFYLNGDMDSSKDRWRKILEKDPDNAVAKQALDGLK